MGGARERGCKEEKTAGSLKLSCYHVVRGTGWVDAGSLRWEGGVPTREGEEGVS